MKCKNIWQTTIISHIINVYEIINLIFNNWPAPPDDPQGIRVASVIEFSVCLFVCLSVCLSVCLFVCLFWANFLILFLQYKATAVRAGISIVVVH